MAVQGCFPRPAVRFLFCGVPARWLDGRTLSGVSTGRQAGISWRVKSRSRGRFVRRPAGPTPRFYSAREREGDRPGAVRPSKARKQEAPPRTTASMGWVGRAGCSATCAPHRRAARAEAAEEASQPLGHARGRARLAARGLGLGEAHTYAHGGTGAGAGAVMRRDAGWPGGIPRVSDSETCVMVILTHSQRAAQRFARGKSLAGGGTRADRSATAPKLSSGGTFASAHSTANAAAAAPRRAASSMSAPRARDVTIAATLGTAAPSSLLSTSRRRRGTNAMRVPDSPPRRRRCARPRAAPRPPASARRTPRPPRPCAPRAARRVRP